MQLPSVEILASWPVPNYHHTTPRGNGVLIVTSILFPLVLSIILIRLYTRLVMSKIFGLDDWLILAAMLPATTFAVLAVLAEQTFYFTRHIWDVPYDRIIFGLKYAIITQVIFTVGQSLTKCSMLALYYRILSKGRNFKIMTIVASTIISVQSLLFVFTSIFQCRPYYHYWTISFAPQPECINEAAHVTSAGAINTFTDLVVVLFPIPSMLHLQIPQRQRTILICLFGAGFLVCIAGAVRTYYTYVEIVSSDRTWDGYCVWISSTIELYVGIIGASVPATKPFFKRYVPFIMPRSVPSSRNENYDVSSGNKRPSPGSTAVATPGASRKSSPSHDDLELGGVQERETKSTRRAMNFDSIEEIGCDASISSFSRIVAKGEKRSSDECKSDEIRIAKRDSDHTPESEDTFHYRTNSKDGLIDERDLGMAAHYKS